MGQILAAGREHDPDFLERACFRPLALGGEAVVRTAYDLFHRYVLFYFRKDIFGYHTSVFRRMGQAGFQFVTYIQSHNHFVFLIYK